MAPPRKRNNTPRRPQVSKEVLREFLAGVVQLAEPVLEAMGFELVMAQCPLEGGRPVLRFFIDKAGAGPEELISLDDCAAFSRALDAALEEAGYDREGVEEYFLEVSSPGLDRPLLKLSDYARFAGRLVKMKIRRDGGNLALRGRLGRTEAGALSVSTTEGPVDFSFDEVLSARLALDELFVNSTETGV